MSRLRAGGLAFAVVSLLLGLWLAPASAVVTQTPNVVARDAHGVVLPDDPLLVPGQKIELTITGFGPQAHLTVRLGTSPLGSYIADVSGTVQFSFVVPLHLANGDYIVAAVGGPPLRSVTPTSVTTHGSVDPQIVQAEVPTLGLFPFHLGPSHSSTSPTRPPPTSPTRPSTSSGAGGSGGSSGSGGHLGNTGVDVSVLLLIGGVGLAGGLLILLPGRKRKHA